MQWKDGLSLTFWLFQLNSISSLVEDQVESLDLRRGCRFASRLGLPRRSEGVEALLMVVRQDLHPCVKVHNLQMSINLEFLYQFLAHQYFLCFRYQFDYEDTNPLFQSQ